MFGPVARGLYCANFFIRDFIDTNQLRPVRSFTRRLNSRKALSDQRILEPLNVNPRKEIRCHAVHQYIMIDRVKKSRQVHVQRYPATVPDVLAHFVNGVMLPSDPAGIHG